MLFTVIETYENNVIEELAKQLHSVAIPLSSGSASFGAPNGPNKIFKHNFFYAPILTQMVLKLPQGHEGSEYVLNFEIGQREGGFYSALTDRSTQYRISK